MSLMQRLASLDRRLLGAGFGQRQGEDRPAYFARLARSPFSSGYVPQQVYEELVDLHRRVARLEERLAATEGRS